jgi:hypothetical protein
LNTELQSAGLVMVHNENFAESFGNKGAVAQILWSGHKNIFAYQA